MIWFHTLLLPIVTVGALWMGARVRMAAWKFAALVGGCGLIVAGLWMRASWSTALLIAGAVTFSVGLPRREIAASRRAG